MNIADGLTDLLHPVADLHELPGNPRRGDVEAVKASYLRFGQRKPIVVRTGDDGQVVVVAGNHQLKAVRELGWDQVAVVWADDLTADEATAFALADNRVADLGSYDYTELADILAGLDTLDATGYSDKDLADLLAIADYATAAESDDLGTASLGAGSRGGVEQYAQSGVRAVVLDYDIETYGQIVTLLGSARDRAQVTSNSDAVLAALRSYDDAR